MLVCRGLHVPLADAIGDWPTQRRVYTQWLYLCRGGTDPPTAAAALHPCYTGGSPWKEAQGPRSSAAATHASACSSSHKASLLITLLAMVTGHDDDRWTAQSQLGFGVAVHAMLGGGAPSGTGRPSRPCTNGCGGALPSRVEPQNVRPSNCQAERCPLPTLGWSSSPTQPSSSESNQSTA